VEWSAAHEAVELEDLIRLRALLDADHDAEDDDGDGWTLLRHAMDTEIDGHIQTGNPLDVDVTALLLARGADPLRECNGVPAVAEAELRGHWLAIELMRAWKPPAATCQTPALELGLGSEPCILPWGGI
jgi:hypothetical protein